jgi:hypothetical protein
MPRIGTLVLLLVSVATRPSSALDGPTLQKKQASLEDRLVTGLRVQRPADVAFVENVAQAVDRGQLPGKLVDSTYLWAVRRAKKYPFPAFAEALRLQASRLGITLAPPNR